MIVHIKLDEDERTVLWALGAVGRPMWESDLAARVGKIDLTKVLIVLRRLGLVENRHRVALTCDGVQRASRIVNRHEAALTRELRQLDLRDACPEAQVAP